MFPFRRRSWALGMVAGVMIAASLLLSAWIWPRFQSSESRPAPEAQIILESQAGVPFQILIPAYLPGGFRRKEVQVRTDLSGPRGGPMAQLVYAHPSGVLLTLSEWMPAGVAATGQANTLGVDAHECPCTCQGENQGQANRWMVDNGLLRVMGETSDPAILSSGHIGLILSTLAPAGGLLTYSSIQKLPLLAGLPPAQEVPVGANGVQEVVLVVTPKGYDPVHFSVKNGVPVRLTFRQLGNVGCGNELDIQWGEQQTGHLVLAHPNDSQVAEFTPQESDDFLFHCPHGVYQGVMTVVD